MLSRREALGTGLSCLASAFAFGAFLLGRDLLGGTEASPTPSPGATKVAVPTVLGMTASQAEAALNQVGLILGEPRYRQSTTTPGTIFEQDPGATTMVPKGTAVAVTIAKLPSNSTSSAATHPTSRERGG